MTRFNKSETKLLTQLADHNRDYGSAQTQCGEDRRYNAVATLEKKGVLKVTNYERCHAMGARRRTGDYHHIWYSIVQFKLVGENPLSVV